MRNVLPPIACLLVGAAEAAAEPTTAPTPAAPAPTASPTDPKSAPDRCGRHGCPIEAVRVFHPLFTHAFDMRGGPMLGFVFGLAHGDPDPDAMQLSLGWQLRGDAFGLPGKLSPILDVLYAVETRWGQGEYVVLPRVEIAHAAAPMFPILQYGIGIGLPVRFRGASPAAAAALGNASVMSEPAETRPGIGFYLHQHFAAVIDMRMGIEWFPHAARDGAVGTMAVHVTL